jgi:hypothetical protein
VKHRFDSFEENQVSDSLPRGRTDLIQFQRVLLRTLRHRFLELEMPLHTTQFTVTYLQIAFQISLKLSSHNRKNPLKQTTTTTLYVLSLVLTLFTHIWTAREAAGEKRRPQKQTGGSSLISHGQSYFGIHNLQVTRTTRVRGGTDKSLARPTSLYRRTESIASLENRWSVHVPNCKSFKEACQATRAI